MAYIATHSTRIHPGIFARAASRIGQFFVDYAETHSRYHHVQALQALSDEELAARGITREGIVAYVFSDRFYL